MHAQFGRPNHAGDTQGRAGVLGRKEAIKAVAPAEVQTSELHVWEEPGVVEQ